MYYCLQYSSGFDELLFTVFLGFVVLLFTVLIGFDELLFTVFLGFVVLLYTVFLVLMHYVYWWMYLIEWKNHVIYFFFRPTAKQLLKHEFFKKAKVNTQTQFYSFSAQSSESKFKRAFLIIGILAHLSWKLKWAFLIPCCLSVRLSIPL